MSRVYLQLLQILVSRELLEFSKEVGVKLGLQECDQPTGKVKGFLLRDFRKSLAAGESLVTLVDVERS